MNRQTYKQYQESVKEEQKNLSKEEIKEEMQKRSDFMLELDALQPQEHRWVDRGQVMSCEGGTHPNHRSFKRLR